VCSSDLILKNYPEGTINVPYGGYFSNSAGNFYVDSNQIFTENRGVINNHGNFYEVYDYDGIEGLFFENHGTINNYSDYYPYQMNNYGIVNNYSVINLPNYYPNTPSKIINNYSILNNFGTIKGSGIINNINGITNNIGVVSPSGTLWRENNQFGSLSFSDYTGTPTFQIEIADTNSVTGHDFVTVNDTLNAGGTINISISYLPNPNDEITIMHADTVVNQFDTVNIPSGWSLLYNYPSKGDVSVKYDKIKLNVKAFLEGYYNGNSTMKTLLHNIGLTDDTTAVDSIEVQMWSPDYLNLTEPTFTTKTILHNDGNVNLRLPINMIGKNYYICIKHKNSIETWSAEPITISTVNNYDFTISQDKAYSNNFDNPMKSMPDGNFAIYSGDINQDGTIDIFDMMNAENDVINFDFGNILSDCNGDGVTDIFDMMIIENNAGLFIYYASPRLNYF
jgi:hypothetical protein